MTMMNRGQRALPHPDNSWSRKRSAKIEMSSQIQANRSMNQKIDRMMSQKFMAGLQPRGAGGRSLPADHHHCQVRARTPHLQGAIAGLVACRSAYGPPVTPQSLEMSPV